MVVRLSHRKKADILQYTYQALGSAFALTGVAATLRVAWRMSVPDKIPYVLTGQAATLTPPTIAPPASESSFFTMPSLVDERATYSLLGWTPLAGAETLVFSSDPGVLSGIDVHNDTESDDLWTWYQQERRGYSGVTTTWRNRWLTYFKDVYLGTVQPGSTEHTSGEYDHMYGTGLALYGYLSGDSAAITAAEAIGDFVIAQRGSQISSGNNSTGYGGGRDIARWGLLFCYLVEATGKSKWATWRNYVLACYMTGTGSTWVESPSLGIVQGGHYFVDRTTYTIGNWNSTGTLAEYDAGKRVLSTWMGAMHAEFMIRCYMQTGRADIRDRIVKMAAFNSYYAHDPAQTTNGGPFCGAYYGLVAGGGRYHRDNGGPATYDCAPINTMVWGYKLSGTASYLTFAQTLLRKGTLYAEAEPPGAALCTSTQVYKFIDISREHPGIADDIAMGYNKGRLQYCYQVFENGGQPANLNSNVPAYIRNLAEGSATTINTRLSDAFQSFSGEAGTQISCQGYSGGAYDTKRNRLLLHGGGHNGSNANGVWELRLYDSETPTFNLFKSHTTPPSVTNFTVPSVETAPNGDPASSHTYNQIVYDAYQDKLVVCGLGSAAGQNGASFARFRLLNLTTNAWDAISGSLQGSPSDSMYSASFAYDSVGRQIIGRGGTSQGRWYRYDSVTGTLTQLTLSGTGSGNPNIDGAAAIDPNRRYMIVIGGYGGAGPLDSGSADMVLLDLTTLSGSSVTSYGRTLTGFPAALRGAKIGLEFHPPSGSFVAWVAPNSLYRLIPPSNPFTGTWTFLTLTPGGTGLPTVSTDSEGGVYSKFRWAPYPHDKSRGVFVMSVNQGSGGSYTTSLVHIYKPNFGTAFTTSFDLTENPISESGAWTQTATAWKDVRTTGGYATGAAYITEGLYDDNYTRLTTSAFSAPSDNYEVVATVRKVSEGVTPSEIEILLRVVDTATTINCYEVLVNVGGSCELVRWNGTMGNFFEIVSTSSTISGWTGNGDKIKARVTGTNPVVVTVSHAPASNPTNFTQVFQYSDTDATRKQTGQPGIAFYAHASDNNLLNAGWQDFTVTAI